MKKINFHIITSDKNTGYGKATLNMIELFKATGHVINIIHPGRKAPVADIDFFLRPPVWTGGTSKRKIAYFYWEAIPLPQPWAASLNSVDEIWAPCELVKRCCEMAGFKGKIHIVPTPAMPIDFSEVKDLEIESLSNDSFVFYSIFQWHNRKGWRELLSAYFDEFNSNENVSLIVKTNPINPSLQNEIINNVISLKSDFSYKETPKLVLLPYVMSEEEILSIHKRGHCYVAPHHGEGWGMPIHDAIMAGKQIIATKFGGVIEFLQEESFHSIPFKMSPVTGMEWNAAYSPNQSWASPDVGELKKIMRDVFSNYKKYISKNMVMNKDIDKISFNSILVLVKSLI